MPGKKPRSKQVVTPSLPLGGSFHGYLEPLASILGKKYTFVREIARGKTGLACEIRSAVTLRSYCLKTISDSLKDQAKRKETAETLSKEVKILSPLRHRCLPVIHEHRSGELPFYVSTYHPGETFEIFRRKQRKLSLRNSIEVIWSLMDVLKYLHQQGRQHCDLHSGNVMISEEVIREGILVIDFSSGHRVSESSSHTPDRGNIHFKDIHHRARAGLNADRDPSAFEQNDFRALGGLLAQMAESFFADASPVAKNAYFDFCDWLINGTLKSWNQIEEKFLGVVDPYRAWNENAALFLSAQGTPQTISVPATDGVAVGDAPLAVVNTSKFQALRARKQLSFCDWFFPGANHTRFEHCLGVFSRAKEAIEALMHDRTFRGLVTHRHVRGFLLASLIHDIGHYPFAHVIEQYAASRLWGNKEAKQIASHFEHTLWLIDHDAELRSAIDSKWGPDARACAIEVLKGNPSILAEILDGPIDVDKMDYLLRDAVHCGVPFGAGQDTNGLLRGLRCTQGGLRLGIAESAVPAALGLMVLQDQMLSSVYWHPTIRGLICMFHAVLAYTIGRDLDKFRKLVDEIKNCVTDNEAIETVLESRIEKLPPQPQKMMQRLLRPIRELKFKQIYVPIATYSRHTRGALSVYHMMVRDTTHTGNDDAEPIAWPAVRLLRYAFLEAFKALNIEGEKAHIVVDVPYGKASRAGIPVQTNDGRGEVDITEISHLKESIFSMPASLASPVRVYVAPELVEDLTERQREQLVQDAERRYLDKGLEGRVSSKDETE